MAEPEPGTRKRPPPRDRSIEPPVAGESATTDLYLSRCVYGAAGGSAADLDRLYRLLVAYTPMSMTVAGRRVPILHSAVKEQHWRATYGEPTLEIVCAQLSRLFGERPDLLPLPAVAPGEYPERPVGIAALPAELMLLVAQYAGKTAPAASVSRAFARAFATVRADISPFLALAQFLVRIGVESDRTLAKPYSTRFAHLFALGPVQTPDRSSPVLWYASLPPLTLAIESVQWYRPPASLPCVSYAMLWPREVLWPWAIRHLRSVPFESSKALQGLYSYENEALSGRFRSFGIFDPAVLASALASGILAGARRIYVTAASIATYLSAIVQAYPILRAMLSPHRSGTGVVFDADQFALALSHNEEFGLAFDAVMERLEAPPPRVESESRPAFGMAPTVPIVPTCSPEPMYEQSWMPHVAFPERAPPDVEF